MSKSASQQSISDFEARSTLILSIYRSRLQDMYTCTHDSSFLSLVERIRYWVTASQRSTDEIRYERMGWCWFSQVPPFVTWCELSPATPNQVNGSLATKLVSERRRRRSKETLNTLSSAVYPKNATKRWPCRNINQSPSHGHSPCRCMHQPPFILLTRKIVYRTAAKSDHLLTKVCRL